MKLQTLMLEVDRRMSNMDSYATIDEYIKVLAAFTQKWKDSEYRLETRKEILMSGLTKYGFFIISIPYAISTPWCVGSWLHPDSGVQHRGFAILVVFRCVDRELYSWCYPICEFS